MTSVKKTLKTTRSHSGKIKPNLDPEYTKIMNLTVLQRTDPSIQQILFTSSHVTLYSFSIDDLKWSRKNVDGPLFVVKRNTQPQFQFIVMNRRHTDNLIEDILGDFEFEINSPYIFYKSASQENNGIWFFTASDVEEVASLLNSILNEYSKAPSMPQISSSNSEFKELETVPTLSEIEARTVPSVASPTATDAREDSPLVNFFNAMKISNNGSNGANPGQIYHNSTNRPLSSSHAPIVTPSPIPTLQIPILTTLLKPSSFFTPHSSHSALMMPPIALSTPTSLQPPLTLQRPYGSPMLQPFPPPTPMSLTPSPIHSTTTGPVISRDKVRQALLMLSQDNQFTDMLYQALVKVHHL